MRAALIFVSCAIVVGCSSGDDGTFDQSKIPPDDSGAQFQDVGVDADAPTTAFRHHRCGWLFQHDDTGKAAFLANLEYFDVVHPTGWILDPTDAFTAKALTGVPDPDVIAAAKAHGIPVWPMIASGDSPEGIAAEQKMWNDATLRDKHVASIVDVVTSGGYAGIDVDYEHMPSTEGPAYVAFLVELAKALHAKGKQLSLASEALWTAPSGPTPWDYATFATNLDAIHLMAYDFHHPCCTHPGEVAPLGWVQDICTHVASVAGSNVGKFILGLPNYGYACATSKDCAAACASAIATTTDEMLTCPLNENHWIAGRAPNCTQSDGSKIFFEDTPSMEEKVLAAQKNGLGGVTEWTVGNEPDGFFAMVRTHY